MMSDQSDRVPVAYIITSLSMGGAQKVLLQLLESDLGKTFPSACLIVLRRVEGLEASFAALGIPILYVELNKPWKAPGNIIAILRFLREHKVGLVYSIMHHANLFACLLSLFNKGKFRLVWSIHDNPIRNLYKRLDHRFFLWLTCRLSGVPDRIVLVSVRSRQRYIELNYPAKQITVIPNGIAPDQPAKSVLVQDRREVRKELKLGSGVILIGSLTRYVMEKDIPCMLEAFSLISRGDPSVYLVLAGEGMDGVNQELQDLLAQYDIAQQVILLGMRSDSQRLIRALDVATLSSRSEALPLFIAEAMGAGTPCVATDVGDIPLLMGGTGRLVPAGQPQALVRAWRETLGMTGTERWSMIEDARQRVRGKFSVKNMLNRHAELFAEVLK